MGHVRHAWLCVLCTGVAVLAGCSNSNPTPELRNAGLQVVEIQPSDGSNAVDPGTEITVRFERAVNTLAAADFLVVDGAAPLAGVIEPLADGVSWRWLASEPLPLGANLTVRLAAGIRSTNGVPLVNEVTSEFSVREATVSATYDVPTGNASVLVWPNGRRAVSVGQRGYEVVTGALLDLPNAFGGGAVPYGDGSYIELITHSALGFAFARRNLDGSSRLIVRPSSQPNLKAVNAAGDAVLAGYVAPPYPAWQLWRLPVDASVAEPLPTISAAGTAAFHPVIAPDGAIWVGYRDVDTGLASLAHIAKDSTAVETFQVTGSQSVGEVHCGVADDGVVTLAWVEGPRTLRVARKLPGEALVASPDAVTLPVVADSVGFALQVAATGSAIVRVGLRFNAPLFVEQYSFLRLERDGWVGFPTGFGNSGTTPPIAKFEPRRGEWWVLQQGPQASSLQRRRSRPGAPLASLSPFYLPPLSGQSITGFDYSFDQLGRAVIVVQEYFPSPTARVLVLE